jgi:hypothetical protein
MFGFFDSLPAFLFIFFGFLSIFVFLYDFFCLAMVKWKMTFGKINKSFVKESFNKANDDLGSAWLYSAVLEYEFEVLGEKVIGSSLYVGKNFASSNKAEVLNVVNKYNEDSVVKVYYDVDNIATSCLDKNIHRSSYFFLFMGVFFCVVGGVIFVF